MQRVSRATANHEKKISYFPVLDIVTCCDEWLGFRSHWLYTPAKQLKILALETCCQCLSRRATVLLRLVQNVSSRSILCGTSLAQTHEHCFLGWFLKNSFKLIAYNFTFRLSPIIIFYYTEGSVFSEGDFSKKENLPKDSFKFFFK